MNNFENQDKVAAAMVLDHFVFISSGSVEAMLIATYRQLRNRIFSQMSYGAAVEYLDNLVFTSVEGEDPNVTDSGNFMCRKLRQVLALPDNRFVEPDEAFKLANTGKGIVFVDDFLGSGSQFLSTWKRDYPSGSQQSFKTLYDSGSLRAHYIVLVATRNGIDRLQSDIDGFAITTSHVLDNSMSVRALPWNPLSPDEFDPKEEIPKFLEKYSARLHVDQYLEHTEGRQYGYGSLGLLIAFEHSTPDATIPLLWAPGPQQWTPLIRRV